MKKPVVVLDVTCPFPGIRAVAAAPVLLGVEASKEIAVILGDTAGYTKFSLCSRHFPSSHICKLHHTIGRRGEATPEEKSGT